MDLLPVRYDFLMIGNNSTTKLEVLLYEICWRQSKMQIRTSNISKSFDLNIRVNKYSFG
jgi:hypothetical protein